MNTDANRMSSNVDFTHYIDTGVVQPRTVNVQSLRPDELLARLNELTGERYTLQVPREVEQQPRVDSVQSVQHNRSC